MKKFYSKEFCVNEGLKYERRTDFHDNSFTAYKYAIKNGWINDACSHMPEIIKPNNYWNFEHCRDNALKYKRRTDFRKSSSGAYSAARINGWLDIICEHMIKFSKPHGYWTIDKCREIALKYDTKKEFLINDKTAYKMAHKKKWIDEICVHMKICGNYYNKCVYVYEFPDNHAYVGIAYNLDVRKRNRKSNKNDAVTKHIKKTNLTPIIKQLTEIIPINEASKQEIYFVEKYKNENWNILNVIKAGGAGYHKIIWTYNKIRKVALKYNKRTIFRKNYPGAYDSAWRNGWLNDICSHMVGNKIKKYWTFKLCEKEMIGCNSRMEFCEKNRGAYYFAINNNWMDKLFPIKYKLN